MWLPCSAVLEICKVLLVVLEDATSLLFFFVEVGVIAIVCSSASYSMLYLLLYSFQGHASAHSILTTDRGK